MVYFLFNSLISFTLLTRKIINFRNTNFHRTVLIPIDFRDDFKIHIKPSVFGFQNWNKKENVYLVLNPTDCDVDNDIIIVMIVNV